MPKVEEIKIITIDGSPVAVDTQSAEVKQLVALYNDWAQDESDARSKLMQVSSAKQALSAQINQLIQKEIADKAAAVEAEAAEKAPAEAPSEVPSE